MDTSSIKEDFDPMTILSVIQDGNMDSDAGLQLIYDDFLSGLMSGGDGQRWTTINFAYQLACYQVKPIALETCIF